MRVRLYFIDRASLKRDWVVHYLAVTEIEVI
jgi:hypothetical protein